MDEHREELKEIKGELKEIKQNMAENNVQMARYNTQLEIHIAGVKNLDERVKPLEDVYAFFRVLAKITGIAYAASAVYKVFHR